MSNFQWSIIVFLAVIGFGAVILMLLAGGNRRSPGEQAADDAEQIEAVSRPAPLLWGDAQQITRRRAGSQGD